MPLLQYPLQSSFNSDLTNIDGTVTTVFASILLVLILFFAPSPPTSKGQLKYSKVVRIDLQTYDHSFIKRAKRLHTSCGICLDDFQDCDSIREIDSCGHFFHSKCCDPWFAKCSRSCPSCRVVLAGENDFLILEGNLLQSV